MARPVFVFTPLSCLITPILSMLEDSGETHQSPIFDQIPNIGGDAACASTLMIGRADTVGDNRAEGNRLIDAA